LQIEFGFDQFYPIIGPIGATFRGNIGASADLTFGLDSAAFLDGNNILEGLFVDDLDASGRDVTEVRLFGSITAGASFNLAVAEAGVDGGIFANVDLNLNDPNNDGKVRLQEIQDNFSLAPVYVFDVSGELTAGLVAFAEVDLFFWERRWERRFAEVTLLDFNLSRPDGSTFNPGDVTPDGTLTLTSSGGSDEPARDSAARNNSPTAFRYRIIPGENPGDVFIQTRGNLFERNGVRNLRFDGSSGDDSIFVDPDVQLLPGGTIELNGGGGDDTISGGTQPSVLRGGPGDDVLTAGGGRVSLFGGTGNDQLTGSTLDDFLDGGPDDDFIDGSAGNDELLGGDGDDLLFGNLGNDTLRGGAGVDELSGDAGNDLLTSDAGVVFRAETIFGGAGNDTIVGGQNIEGGRGDDEITASTSGRGATVFGGVGNDAITGTPDADALYGDDSVLGGTGNDVITALDGDDLIITHNGNNTVDAGAGNDSVEGGLNVDVVTGGAGDDFIQLSSGNDTATGNAGLDTIAGGAGNDDIDGGTDADVLSGGGLDDLVVGGEGDDTIAGNAGDDTLVGQGGNDRITGDDTDEGFGGNDSLFGGPGSDILRGGGGNDQLHGNAGIDELFGGDGNDSLFGGTQTDRLDDGRGDDLIRGGTDADLLILDVFDPTANDDFEGFGGNGLAFVNGNIVPDTGNDDSATATDRLVYLGSEGFDDVEVLQVDTPSGTSLQFIYVFQGNGFFLREVAWRALDGTPRFRQVELLLGSGNDVAIIDNSVDTTGVAIPGTSQFVFSIQGGPGNDTIIGSDNAEQLIGGPGSDELFGNGGDDRLWGDDVGGGDRVFDVNRLFGGGGNDDLIGGEGRNFTFAWSRDPLASGTFQPILVNGNVEETGIDRMLGGPADDVFYGAVAPSFIFGNGGNDVIIDTAGEAVSAGTFFADGFADYAQDLDGVWYIAGSNSIKDEIEVTSDVDGVLVDITQFEDAGGGVLQVADQVTRRPDVGQGRANSVEVLRAEFLAAGGISGLAAANNEDDLLDTDRGWAGGRAGTEGVNDFDVIIVDAFGGNDEVTVQGNVPYAVWLYGGEGNDTLTLNSNRSVQPDFLEGPLDPNGNGQNDTRQTASDLGVISGATQFVGLSIHTGLPPADQDWFDFTLAQNAGANDRLILNSLANRDDLLVTVFDGLTEIGTSDATDPNGVSLAGLVAGQTYTLHVRNSAAGGPGAITLYDFNFALGSGDPSQNSIDLSPGLVVSNRDVLFGGPGNDTLVGGLGEDWVFGGPGDDDLAGGRDGLAIDLISGDDGQDTLRLTPGQLPDGVTVSSIASGDILRGDAGGDTVLYEGDEDGTTSVPDFAVLDYNPLFDIYILTAYVWDQSTGNFELIPGTSTRRQVYQAFDATAPVTVDLGDSNDFFSAVSSEQLMDDGNLYGIPIGGPGLTVIADDGRDSLTGGGGDDTIRGGDGDDQLTGSDGRDVIFGEDDNDTIDGGGFRNGGFQDVQLGIELLDGGFGNDTIFGRFGDDSIVGGQGSDVLEGSEGDDTINGNDGNDQMFGGPGADHIETGSGTNFVEGGSQDDSIIGGNNNDQLVGGGGNDSIVANGGDDSVWGGEGNDVIEGRDGRDVLDGGDGGTSVNTGNDSIFGGADDDSIYGADGRDTLFGNDGNDLIDGGNGSSYLDVHPLGGGFESLFGGRGQDTLFGRGGNDSVDGGDGADTLYGGDGSDRLVGGNEETFFSQNDLIFGDLPTVVVWSDGRTDAPFPSNQDDFIDGGLGEDLLFGQGGDDTVIGGSGNDELVGGLGNDLLQGDDGVGGEDGSDLFWARDANVGFGEDLFLDTVVGGDPAGAIDFDFDEVRTVNRFGNGTIVDVLIRVDSVLPAGAVGDFSRPAVFTAANPTWVLPDLNADRSSTRQAPPVNAISGLRTGSDQHELSAVGSRPPQVDQRAFESLFAAELDEETVL
ncbi:MAG: calcium-binding protein, partial [Planctomycetota bacterium]